MNDFKPDIWRLQTQNDIQGLIQALESEDSSTRRRAVSALRSLGAFKAIPHLRAALDRETDKLTRSVLLMALTTLENERKRQQRGEATPQSSPENDASAQHWMEKLNSPDPDQVVAAVRALGILGHKPAVEPLMLLFRDGAKPIKLRLAAAETLLKLESATVEVALLGALRSKNWRVRGNSAAILGQLNADWAVEPLISTLQDEREEVRKAACAALKRINTPEAQAALKSPPPFVTTADEPLPQAGSDDKLEWPRRPRRLDPTKVTTRPLDPRTVEHLNLPPADKFLPAREDPSNGGES